MSVMIAIVLIGCRAAEAGITMMAVSRRAVKTMVARMFLVVIVGPVVFRTVLVVLVVLAVIFRRVRVAVVVLVVSGAACLCFGAVTAPVA